MASCRTAPVRRTCRLKGCLARRSSSTYRGSWSCCESRQACTTAPRPLSRSAPSSLLQSQSCITNEAPRAVSQSSSAALVEPKHKYCAQWQQQRQHRQTIEATGNVVNLRQENFRRGMVEITEDGYVWTGASGETEKVCVSTVKTVFRLKEDITFEPCVIASDACGLDTFMPTSEQLKIYSFPSALRLGWFAAIACSARDVVIDLNGYELKQGKAHYLLQRFHSLIELACSPFIPPQGPQNFGPLHAARNVAVVNGKLGLSSHYGIHSNDTENVLIEDLHISNFEVAAIHMNGAEKLSLCNITAEENCKECPVVGIFSAGVFQHQFCKALQGDATVQLAGVTRTVSDVRDKLAGALNAVLDDFLAIGSINQKAHPEAAALFTNASGEVDGPSYGIVLNGRGVAINGFPHEVATPSKNVYLRNINISDLTGKIREVLALRVGLESTLFQTDGAGAVFQTQNVSEIFGGFLTINDAGEYVGNVVSDAQLTSKIRSDAGDKVPSGNITSDTIAWAAGGPGSGRTLFAHTAPNMLLGSYFFNADSMHHTAKGMVACKLDGVNNLMIEGLSIQTIQNKATRGFTYGTLPLPVSQEHVPGYLDYIHRHGKSNAGASLNGYSGADLRGISLSATSNASLHNVRMNNISSANGRCIAVHVLGKSHAITLRNINVVDLQAGVSRDDIATWYNNPTSLPIAYGVHVGSDVSRATLRNVRVHIAYSHFDKVGMSTLMDSGGQMEICNA